MVDGPRSMRDAKTLVAGQLIKSLESMESVNVEAMRGWSPAQRQRFSDAIRFFIERLKKFC